MLIDSHCHLDFPELKGELDAVIQRARDAGVGAMVTISTRVAKFNELKDIVEAHDNVYCSIGTHPHNAAEEPDVTTAEIAGTFTDWRRIPLNQIGTSGYWDITISLPGGEHRFTYILDGAKRFADPTVAARELDDFGGQNSIISIGSKT